MADTIKTIDFDNNDQIRLLLNLRNDIRILLQAHPKGIWYRMLPKVFYMYFNRDIHLDLFAITNSYLFLDYISDIIKYDLPENYPEEDFIIELNNNNNHDKENLSLLTRINHFKLKRNVLFEMLQNANLEKRGTLLRDICIIDEYLKCINQVDEISSIPKIPTHEQVTIRLQKIRSMIDFYLRYFLKKSDQITDEELIELYENSDHFITNFTPIIQRLSLSTN